MTIYSRQLPNTKTYARLRVQVQETFDFAVVVCYGVPALKRQISLLRNGIASNLPTPDYFPAGKNTPDQLQQQASGYRQKLAAYTLISTFSFFEAFVESAIREMLDFHGGPESFQVKAELKDTHFIENPDSTLETHKQRLRGIPKKAHEQRYEKHSKELVKAGYRFPSQLFSAYGIKMLVQKLGNMKAVDIPDLLEHGLHLKLDSSMIASFHNIREIRNRIAHGDPVSLSLGDVSRYNDVLRNMAYELDKHLNMHFMINENYS
jgi:hypothetical protein